MFLIAPQLWRCCLYLSVMQTLYLYWMQILSTVLLLNCFKAVLCSRTQIVLLFLANRLRQDFTKSSHDNKFNPCDSMAKIISIYSIDFGVGAKFSPKFNKEVTFSSIYYLSVRFKKACFIIAHLLFETICEFFIFHFLNFFFQMMFTLLLFSIFWYISNLHNVVIFFWRQILTESWTNICNVILTSTESSFCLILCISNFRFNFFVFSHLVALVGAHSRNDFGVTLLDRDLYKNIVWFLALVFHIFSCCKFFQRQTL